jgi:hypothetical protein
MTKTTRFTNRFQDRRRFDQGRLPMRDPAPPLNCRYCGDPAVPGLRMCRRCWSYTDVLKMARSRLESERRNHRTSQWEAS